MNSDKDFASAVFIQCLMDNPRRQGKILYVVCIREEAVHKQTFWKLPVGKKLPGETPEETARRVVKNKVGLDISTKEIREVGRTKKVGHDLILFWLEIGKEEISSLPTTIVVGKIRFTIKLKELDDLFTPHEQFFRTHRELIKTFIK